MSSPKLVQKQPLARPPPRLRVVAVNIKTVPDAAGKAQEVVAASLVTTSMRVDGPTETATWLQCRDMQRYTAVRPLDGAAWPVGLQPVVKVRLSTLLRITPERRAGAPSYLTLLSLIHISEPTRPY